MTNRTKNNLGYYDFANWSVSHFSLSKSEYPFPFQSLTKQDREFTLHRTDKTLPVNNRCGWAVAVASVRDQME